MNIVRATYRHMKRKRNTIRIWFHFFRLKLWLDH